VAEQLLGPQQSLANLDDDRKVPTVRILDALRQLVNLGADLLRDAAIVKEGLGQPFAQRDGTGDLVGDERRLKTLSQFNLLGSHACFQHGTTPLRTLSANVSGPTAGWLKVSRLNFGLGADRWDADR
jgi:hypothetical protein